MSGLPDSSIAKKNKKDILRLHTDSGTTRLFLTSTQNKVCCVTHPSEDLVYTPRTCLLAIDSTIISIQICCSLFHSLFPKNEKKSPRQVFWLFQGFAIFPLPWCGIQWSKKNAKPFYWNYSWGYSSGLAPDSLFNPSSMNAWWITCDGGKENQYFPIEQE